MINEEKVRELFNIALCDSKSDDSRVQKQSASPANANVPVKKLFKPSFHI